MKIPNKLKPIPSKVLNVPCRIEIYAEELSSDGEPITAAVIETNCYYCEKASAVTDDEKRVIQLSGALAVNGDIAPDIPVICDGRVTVDGRQLKIYRVKRARQPDGTVHHTTVELI